jgi:hypothetical protein
MVDRGRSELINSDPLSALKYLPHDPIEPGRVCSYGHGSAMHMWQSSNTLMICIVFSTGPSNISARNTQYYRLKNNRYRDSISVMNRGYCLDCLDGLQYKTKGMGTLPIKTLLPNGTNWVRVYHATRKIYDQHEKKCRSPD